MIYKFYDEEMSSLEIYITADGKIAIDVTDNISPGFIFTSFHEADVYDIIDCLIKVRNRITS